MKANIMARHKQGRVISGLRRFNYVRYFEKNSSFARVFVEYCQHKRSIYRLDTK